MRVLTAIVLWIISEMAVAGPLEEANSAYDKGDFGLARNFRATAIAGPAVVTLASCRIRIVRGHRESPRDGGTMAPDAGWLRPT
jgi:hypothetical protein